MSQTPTAEATAAPAAEATPVDSPAAPALSPEALLELAPHLRPQPVAPSDDADAVDAQTPTAATPGKTADAAPAPDAAEDGDAGTEQPTPEAEVATWADQLFDNPQTASRIPRARLPEVFAEINNRMQAAYDFGVQQGQARMQAAAQAEMQRQTLQQKAAEVQAFLDDGDIDGYREAVDAFPGGKRAFARVVAEMEPVAPESPEYYQQRVSEIVAPLAQFPDAVAELQANWNFKATPEDLQRLTFEVGRLLGAAQAKPAPVNPAAEELSKRKQAVAGLRATPKADVSEGRTTPMDGLPFSLEDIKAGRVTGEQIAEAEKTHPGAIGKWSREAAGVR